MSKCRSRFKGFTFAVILVRTHLSCRALPAFCADKNTLLRRMWEHAFSHRQFWLSGVPSLSVCLISEWPKRWRVWILSTEEESDKYFLQFVPKVASTYLPSVKQHFDRLILLKPTEITLKTALFFFAFRVFYRPAHHFMWWVNLCLHVPTSCISVCA